MEGDFFELGIYDNAQLWNEPEWWDNGLQSHDLYEHTELCITGTDACSGSNVNIEYLLFLDLDNDGTMETVINSVNTGIAGLASGSSYPVGVTTVTYQYVDNANNGPATCSFTVTVTDDQDPSLTCPPNLVLNNEVDRCSSYLGSCNSYRQLWCSHSHSNRWSCSGYDGCSRQPGNDYLSGI